MVFLVCIIIILLLGAMLAGLQAFRATTIDEPFNAGVAADNSTVVALSHSVLDDDTLNISLSSNITADAPVLSSYSASSRSLRVTGLDSGTALRRLTVTYKSNQLGQFAPVDLAVKFWPLYYILGLLGVITAAVIHEFKHGD